MVDGCAANTSSVTAPAVMSNAALVPAVRPAEVRAQGVARPGLVDAEIRKRGDARRRHHHRRSRQCADPRVRPDHQGHVGRECRHRIALDVSGGDFDGGVIGAPAVAAFGWRVKTRCVAGPGVTAIVAVPL
jgi:hypothetical protein